MAWLGRAGVFRSEEAAMARVSEAELDRLQAIGEEVVAKASRRAQLNGAVESPLSWGDCVPFV